MAQINRSNSPYTLTAADAASRVITINISALAATTTHSTWYYPGDVKCILWVNSAATPGVAEKVYLAIRGAAGGAGVAQVAIIHDDAPNTPAQDAHATTVTSMISGRCPGSQVPHEFTFHNAGSTVASITAYLIY
jgi:hypothetical protein